MENESGKPRIYVLLGPTAAGKSAVGMEVARRAGAEIISIDSMQVYRGMDIGTAKPSPAEREAVPHHLLDIREPRESFSTAEYVELADAAVRDIVSRGRLPLFVGGTALYIKSLICGIFEGPSADWDFRRRLRAEAAEKGSEALHARLAKIDSEAAARIHPGDMRRIERALEIYEKTGRRPSELRQEWKSDSQRYEAAMAGLDVDREVLRERINARVDSMMAAGWLDEVRRLVAAGGLARGPSQALGYAQLARAAAGELPLEEALEDIKAKTRRFAKRQMTWFRGFGDAVKWVKVGADDTPESVAKRVICALGIAGGGPGERR